MEKMTGLGIDNLNVHKKNYTSSNFTLTKTHPAHKNDGSSVGAKPVSSFKDLLFKSLDEVNSAVNNHEQLRTQSIVNPDSVNSHDVSIAGLKARLSVQMVTATINRALEAYRTIISLR